jgi:hypothetical protein
MESLYRRLKARPHPPDRNLLLSQLHRCLPLPLHLPFLRLRRLHSRYVDRVAGPEWRSRPRLRTKACEAGSLGIVFRTEPGRCFHFGALPSGTDIQMNERSALYRFGILSARFVPNSSTNTWSARNSITLN